MDTFTHRRRPPLRRDRLTAAALALAVAPAFTACSDDGPAAFAAAPVIEVDVATEAKAYNDGTVYEFVVDTAGYVSVPAQLPAGEVMVTLTYVGDEPAPHSLVFEGVNGDQPVVAVDLPGSNNGTVVLPAGTRVFYDGAPGNRDRGYEARIRVRGSDAPVPAVEPGETVSWETVGLAFTSAPGSIAPANVPLTLQLSVADALPHSIAFEGVRGEQPLVAVDGPGTNQRTLTLPPATYVYFCAVPGHREAGMEGTIIIG